jgi:WD40 repeat protein/serine/threonine protein kinase
MVAQSICPDRGRLQRLLDSRLPAKDQGTLIEHLDHCAICQRTMESLAGGTEAWAATARNLATSEVVTEAAIQQLLAQAKPTREADMADEPRTRRDTSLDFLDPPAKPGQLGRLGPYEVTEVIGRGGMSLVLKAFDPKIHRVVAIKVLAPFLAASANARQRFVREARATAAVKNDHVVTLHAVDEANDLPFLVMEYLAGVTLQQRLDQSGPLQVKEILRIAMQAASGLAAAHAQGLIHRDIKPGNILLENGIERVKVTDFGLARAVDDASLSQSGVVGGTPQYMAPEQAMGEPLDYRADLFSLGSVMYVMCTGRLPFRAESTMGVLKRICEKEPPPIRNLNPDIPDWLAAIVAKLLAKDPAARYQSAAEVAEVLGRHLARVQAGGSEVSDTVVQTHPASEGPARLRFVPRRRLSVLAALLLLALVPVSVLVAATVLRIATSKGELIIEAHDPNVEVVVKQNGATIVDRTTQRKLELTAGDYEIDLAEAPAGLHLSTKQFKLERGGKTVVTAQFEPKQATPAGPRVEGRAAQPLPAAPRQAGAALMGAALQGHTAGVTSVAFSPDGKIIVSGSKDRTINLWDAASGKLIRTLQGGGAVTSVAVSPDGKLLASTGQDGLVRLWDMDSGKETHRLLPKRGAKLCAVFSPDGRVLASAGERGTIELWDVASRRVVRQLDQRGEVGVFPQGAMAALAFSPDGRSLASGGSDRHTVTLWDVATGSVRSQFMGRDGRAALAFSPNGSLLAFTIADSTVNLQELATAKLRELTGEGKITAIAFAPDGRTLAVADDRTVRIWDVSTGRLLEVLRGHDGVLTSIAFSPDGKTLVSGGTDGNVIRWDPARQAAGPGNEFKPAHVKGRERSLPIPPGTRTFRGLTAEVLSVAFSPNGGLLAAGSKDQTVGLWDVASGAHIHPLVGHGAGVRSIAFSPDGKSLVSADYDGSVRLWDLNASKEIRLFKGQRGAEPRVAISPDGQLLAYCSGGQNHSIIVWQIASGEAIAVLKGHQKPVVSIAFSPDGKLLASGSWDATVRLWDAQNGEVRAQLQGHDGRVFAVAFSPDGKQLASGSEDKFIRLWDVATGKEVRRLECATIILTVAFSPDGKTLAAGCFEDTVHCWDLATGKEFLAFRAHEFSVSALAFSPDGKYLATEGDGNTVKLWGISAPRP